MRNRLALIFAGLALILAGQTAISNVAQADDNGTFESKVYYADLGGLHQSDIQDGCQCTGTTTFADSNDKEVVYPALNSSFAWNVEKIDIHYHYNGNYWICRNYNGGPVDGDGKARIGFPLYPGGPSQVWDPVGFNG